MMPYLMMPYLKSYDVDPINKTIHILHSTYMYLEQNLIWRHIHQLEK